jgi:hypothetical protein
MQHRPASKDAGLFLMLIAFAHDLVRKPVPTFRDHALGYSPAVKPTRKAPTNKTLVQEHFGKTAATYLTSTPHALGKSLERLVALTASQKTWRAVAAHT